MSGIGREKELSADVPRALNAPTAKKRTLSEIVGLCSIVVFMILVATLIASALFIEWNPLSYGEPAAAIGDFVYEVDGDGSSASAFPHSLSNLAPNTPVTVHVDLERGRYGNILVKTLYSGLRLYADDVLIYECGQKGSYPEWLKDPPMLINVVPLPETASRLRFEYISPSQRDTMRIYALMAGSDGALVMHLLETEGILFVISLFFLVGGLAVTVISLVFRKGNKVFLFLGLFAFALGCWSLGEADFTDLIIQRPVFLYVLSFAGLFSFMAPLLRYGLFILNPRNPHPNKRFVKVKI